MSKLAQAIDHAKSGNKSRAKQLLSEIIKSEPRNELAWLWMTDVLEDANQQAYCLEQILKINPNNQKAVTGLANLKNLKSQVDSRVMQIDETGDPAGIIQAINSNYRALPLPDASNWSNGFRGWSILDKFIETSEPISKLGILIDEAHFATKRVLGWAAFFTTLAMLLGILAVLFGIQPTRDYPTVLVLAGFAVIFLGAAMYRTTTWYLNKDLRIGIYREGFMLTKAGKTEVVYWREIDYVKEQWQKNIYEGINVEKHKVEIHKTDGQKLEIDRAFEKIDKIGLLIQLAVADYLLPVKLEQLNHNDACDFGTFKVSRFGITHKEKKLLPWNEVKSLDIHNIGQTILKIQKIDSSKRGSAWASENGGTLKNLQLFLSLSYWFIHASRQNDAPTTAEADNGDVHYKLLITKKEALEGTQKALYVGTSMHERRLVVKIPAGVQQGSIYRFPNDGRPSRGGSTSGTLNIEVIAEKITALQKRLEELQLFGGGLILLFSMMWLGFWSSLDLVSSFILAALMGGLGGGIMSIRQRRIGVFSGVVGGAVCFLLQIVYYQFMYIAFGRESFWNYESVLVLFLSALPGIGLYILLKKIFPKKAGITN